MDRLRAGAGALGAGFVQQQTTLGTGRLLLWILDIILSVSSIIVASQDINNPPSDNDRPIHNRLYISTGVFVLLTFLIELGQMKSQYPSLPMVTMGILGFFAILFIVGSVFAIGRLVARDDAKMQEIYSQTNVLGLFGGVLIAALLSLLFLQAEEPGVYFLLATAVISAAILSIDTTIVRMRYYADK